MLATINNSFSYNGQVTLKLTDKKTKKVFETRVIKNAGTKNLFKFLCDCLEGTYKAADRPRYLDASAQIYNYSEASFSTNVYYRSLLNTPNVAKENNSITLDDGTRAVLENWHTRYSAVLLQNQLDQDAKDSGIKSLALFNSPDLSDNSNAMLAWINLLDDSGNAAGIKINDNQALIIEWDLSFDNYIKNIIE